MTSGLLRPNGFNRSQRILADQDAGEEMEEARSRTLTCGNHDVTRSVSPRESGLPQVEHQYSNNNIVYLLGQVRFIAHRARLKQAIS